MKQLLVVITILLLTGCSYENDMIQDINDNSAFPYPLMYQFTEEEKANFVIEEAFGMDVYYDSEFNIETDNFQNYLDDKEGTIIEVSGYPDCLDDYKVTRITTTDPDVTVYDYRVGYVANERFIKYMTDKGYIYNDEFIEHGQYRFEYENLYLRFYTEDDIITKIVVYIQSTNNQGVIF